MQPLIVVEMNEVCFDYVNFYIKQGKLKNFSKFFNKHGYCRTTSVTDYEKMEPWIQWVSARTGLPFQEHGVFRLGDIVNEDLRQHWEILEEAGFTVAACSPINAANNTKSSPFWIPDPWVSTRTSGDQSLKQLGGALKQAVNSNASESISIATLIILLKTLLTKTKLSSWSSYIKSLIGVAKRQHWSKALILDRLLGDVFFKEWRRHKPNFSTLFLNSAAHIQHHYMFNSKAYTGVQKNPDWYVKPDADPVFEIYELYDRFLAEALATGARIIVATGLTQLPYEKLTFYYRLKDHSNFLNRLGIKFQSVEPRMSRDFLVTFENNADAAVASNVISNIYSAERIRIFDVDNRGSSLFVTLSYPDEIGSSFGVFTSDKELLWSDFAADIAFVAIKNGHHDPKGFYMDTEGSVNLPSSEIPIEDLFGKCLTHFRISESIVGSA